jgi:transposase
VKSTVLAASLLLLASAAFSADPKIETLSAHAVNRQVSVRFTMGHAFDREQTIQGLQSGVPTSLVYIVEAYRDRPNWFDEGIARARIEVIATFNSLTREYLLNYRRDHKLVRSETFSDLASLERAMTTIDEPALFDIGKRPAHKVMIRVKSDLMRGWLFYFIPGAVSTRWKSVRVAAPPENGR